MTKSKFFQKTLNALKPKVKAFGFSRKEVESAAATIADNLDIEDDASDEDVANAIDEAIDSAVPFFKLAQKSASRQVRKVHDELNARNDDDDDDDPDSDNDDYDDDDDVTPKKSKKSPKANPAKSNPSEGDSELMKLIKRMNEKLDQQDAAINALKEGKTSDSRRAKLQKILENTGSFGKRTLRDFDKMKFDSEEDFEDYCDEVKTDLEDLNQERANAGLGKLGNPPSSSSKSKTKKSDDSDGDEGEDVEVMDDKELDDFASKF